MSRLACLSLLILLLALLAGCAAPGVQTVPTAALETPAGETPPEAHELPATALPTQPPVETEPPAPTAVATLEPSLEPSASPSAEPGLAWIAFTGMDGNIWLVDAAGREQRRVTQDAVPYKVGEPQPEREVTYSNPVWSTDGRMLAFRQQIGVAVETGYEYTFALFVHDLETGETRTLVEGETVGSFAWKPGEAVLAYGAPIDFDYFQRGAPNSDLARGLQAVDAASGETFELVKPERGFHLINPRWSQDGRFVAFEEVQYIEGRGLVAINQIEAQE